MICASDDPEHADALRPLVPLHRQRAVGPRPRRGHRRPRLDDPRRPRAARAVARSRARHRQWSPDPPRDRPTDHRPAPRHPRPARRARRQPGARDPPGHRPDRRQGRGPRDHGPQRLGQDDARLRADGPPGLHGQRRRGHLEGPRHPRPLAGQARAPRPVPRVPVPDGDPRPERRELHPQRPQRQAPGHRQGRRHRPDRPGQGRRLDARLPQQDAREDGAAAHGRGLRHALRQRGLLGRREEAPRDAPDGRARARDGDPRRDRLGPRHRRAADRRRGRQRDAQPEPRRAAHHPLPAPAQLHQARRRPRPRPGPHRQERRQGPRPAARGRGLRPDPARGRPRRRTPPTRRCSVPDRAPSSSSSPWRPPASRATRRDLGHRGDPQDAAAALDPDALRADFPILDAGDQRPPAGLSRLGVDAARSRRSSSTRSPTTTASTTPTSIAASTRSARRRRPRTRTAARRVARFINAPDSHEVVFTRNATEAINLVAYAGAGATSAGATRSS